MLPVPLPDITAFVVLRATAGNLRRSTVVRATLVGDPAGRLDAVPDPDPADPTATLDGTDLVTALSGASADEQSAAAEPAGLRAHVRLALQTIAGSTPPTDQPPDLAETVAAIGLHAPGNIAWRALGRLLGAHQATSLPPDAADPVTPRRHWLAAATLAAGLRSLFSRLETTLLLDGRAGAEPYWRTVLAYCAGGNLQAVLDEYLHHLADAEGLHPLTGSRLLTLATTAAAAIALRPSRYVGFDPDAEDHNLPFTCRFALRYGGRRHTEDSTRQPEVRQAFNSPFWPFVLATTSVGQEGIDFHWWSHAVFHWNTPANPVDFEQREGRVHRYAGHAVRRNIAARHRAAILISPDPDPWQAAYAVATDQQATLGEFSPHWVYPGPARIQRHLAPYPLSIDTERYTRLKDDLALYRLTFGQPRQEDMLDLLHRRSLTADEAERACLDLRPNPPADPPNPVTTAR